MKRLFRIDFYPADWLIGTGKMTPVQRGIYIQIIAMIYNQCGPIDNDPKEIARQSNCSVRLVNSVLSDLFRLGKLVENGSKITQQRCELELNSKDRHLEHSMNGGRKSAEKKAELAKNNDLGIKSLESETHSSLPTTSPSPSPSPIASPYTPKWDEDFLVFWKAYPKGREGSKEKAQAAYLKAVKRSSHVEIMEGVSRYAISSEVASGYVKGCAAWLNDDRWKNSYTPSISKKKTYAEMTNGERLEYEKEHFTKCGMV